MTTRVHMRHLILVLLCLALGHMRPAATTFPPPDEFAANVRRAMARGLHADATFTYVERRRDIDISMLGGVRVGPLRTFEVYPPHGPGQTYKRLIAVDGQPLSEAELARRDAEHARHLREAAARAHGESARERAARLRKDAEEQRELEAILDDAVAVFEPVFAARERIDGRPVLVVDVRPRAGAVAETRQGTWMQHFTGRIWVDASDHQLVRVDMRAFRDITIGWGVVGRIDEGSRLRFSRRRFENAWLPAELTYEASGRTLLVRPFRFAVTTTYDNYRPRIGEPMNPPVEDKTLNRVHSGGV